MSARGDVVEEEERLGALHEYVVHAVIDEILADRVVPAGEESDLELRSDAVDARDEHRLRHAARHREEPAEVADLGEHLRPPRLARERGDAFFRPVRGVDIDARFTIPRAHPFLLETNLPGNADPRDAGIIAESAAGEERNLPVNRVRAAAAG